MPEYNTDFQRAGQRLDNAMILKCNDLSIRLPDIIISIWDAHLLSTIHVHCGHRFTFIFAAVRIPKLRLSVPRAYEVRQSFESLNLK